LESSYAPDRPGNLTPENTTTDPSGGVPWGWFLRGVLYLVLVVGVLFYISNQFELGLTFWARIAIAGMGLGAVIFVHELGHFLVAKWCDVHVEAFSIGFGPPLPGCSLKRGETTYKIALFPLGGYVKMVGEGADNDENDTDPRSFKNKSVWQRMAIISAGVIMNLILALFLFVYVFLTHGDEQIPSVVNVIDAGSPAWEKGVRTGDVIYWIDNKGPNPSFNDHLMPAVINTTEGEAIRFAFGPPGATETQIKDTQIIPRRAENTLKPEIGISAPPQLKLAGKEVKGQHSLPVMFNSAASRAQPTFEFADEIVGSTDPEHPESVIALPLDPRNAEHHDYFEFRRRMVRLTGKEVVVRVRRGDENELVDIRVPPAFHHTLGLRMRTGPIAAVREASPATAAGVRQGDIIDEVEVTDGARRLVFAASPLSRDGVTYQPLDPIRLPFELAQWAKRQPSDSKKEVALTVLRKNSPPDHAEVRPVKMTLSWDDSWWGNVEKPVNSQSPMALPGLGLAYRVETTVADVEPNSPAQAAGLQKGDVIKAVRFYSSGKTPEDQPSADDWFDLQADQWANVSNALQNAEVKKIDVKIDRDATTRTLVANEDLSWPSADHGLLLVSDTRLQHFDSVASAIAMGLTKTKNFIMTIYGNLRGIITGRISVKLMGGPIMIGQKAFEFAGEIHRFLIFIAIISVNLAVVNFLPIPVLDGGHMMFLIYEKLRGKPAPERVRVAATMAGLAALLLLMGFVIYLDVSRLI
jgi:regulator of sigma E protease